MSSTKEYSISLGLTDEEISDLKEGQPVSFIFTDKNFPKINVVIEHKEDDLPLDHYMKLSVGNLGDKREKVVVADYMKLKVDKSSEQV